MSLVWIEVQRFQREAQAEQQRLLRPFDIVGFFYQVGQHQQVKVGYHESNSREYISFAPRLMVSFHLGIVVVSLAQLFQH
jgi:hypothetical protein